MSPVVAQNAAVQMSRDDATADVGWGLKLWRGSSLAGTQRRIAASRSISVRLSAVGAGETAHARTRVGRGAAFVVIRTPHYC